MNYLMGTAWAIFAVAIVLGYEPSAAFMTAGAWVGAVIVVAWWVALPLLAFVGAREKPVGKYFFK